MTIPESGWTILAILDHNMSIRDLCEATGFCQRKTNYAIRSLRRVGAIGVKMRNLDMRMYWYFRK